jgi:hypothetical protein
METGSLNFFKFFHLRSPQKPCTTFRNILYFLRQAVKDSPNPQAEGHEFAADAATLHI